MKIVVFIAVSLVFSFNVATQACDLHSVFSFRYPWDQTQKGLHFTLSEQFTRFGTLQLDGEKVASPVPQYLNSSVTQFVGIYNFDDRSGLQVNLPFTHRSFQRLETAGLEQGTESGLGDISLLGIYSPFRQENGSRNMSWRVFGGVKLPTGDSDRLQEELDEHHMDHHDEALMEHEQGEEPEAELNGIHGHDLALGSGSVDGIIGTEFFSQWNRFFVSGHLQYAIRTTGDFDYRFGNDLLWQIGPAAYLITGDQIALALEANLSGEYKQEDKLAGVEAQDTALTATYAGPVALIHWKNRLSAEFGIEFRLQAENSGLQTVPDHRIRAGINWKL